MVLGGGPQGCIAKPSLLERGRAASIRVRPAPSPQLVGFTKNASSSPVATSAFASPDGRVTAYPMTCRPVSATSTRTRESGLSMAAVHRSRKGTVSSTAGGRMWAQAARPASCLMATIAGRSVSVASRMCRLTVAATCGASSRVSATRMGTAPRATSVEFRWPPRSAARASVRHQGAGRERPPPLPQRAPPASSRPA